MVILLPKNREAHKRVFILGSSGGGRLNQVYKELQSGIPSSGKTKGIANKWGNYKTNISKVKSICYVGDNLISLM